MNLPPTTPPIVGRLHLGQNVGIYCGRRAGEVPEHSHDCLQISLIFDPGVCDFRWKDAQGTLHVRRLTGPQFLMVAPHVPHSCHWEKESDLVVIYIHERCWREILREGTEGCLVSDCVPGAAQDAVVWQLAWTLREVYFENDETGADLLEEIAGSVAKRTMKVLSGLAHLRAPTGPKLAAHQVKLVEDLIYARLAETIRVEDLAKKVGLSLAHFTLLFTKATGLSPYRFITRCRMLKAKEMLLTGMHRIGEVARAVGFPDQGYFAVRFKEYFHCSPRSVVLHGHVEQVESPNFP